MLGRMRKRRIDDTPAPRGDGHPACLSVEERLRAVLRFARFEGPTGDIDRMLAEIERGRGLS